MECGLMAVNVTYDATLAFGDCIMHIWHTMHNEFSLMWHLLLTNL